MATGRGGQKFETALRAMSQQLSGKPRVKVGFLAGATYPDGTPVAMIAAINEYGKPPSQPPRPFFRRMINKYQGEWAPAIKGLLHDNKLPDGAPDVERVLDLTGEAVEGQLRQSILDLWSPPLADSTVARKGFDKPLIETSHMINSVGHKVVEAQG